MSMETGFKEYLDAMRKRMEGCQDICELRKMQDDLRDVLIEIIPVLINTEKGMRKKMRLRRTFTEIVAERHGI